MLGDVQDEGLALLRVGALQDAAIGAQPLNAGYAMQRDAVGVPACRIGSAKAVEQLLRLRQA